MLPYLHIDYNRVCVGQVRPQIKQFHFQFIGQMPQMKELRCKVGTLEGAVYTTV